MIPEPNKTFMLTPFNSDPLECRVTKNGYWMNGKRVPAHWARVFDEAVFGYSPTHSVRNTAHKWEELVMSYTDIGRYPKYLNWRACFSLVQWMRRNFDWTETN